MCACGWNNVFDIQNEKKHTRKDRMCDTLNEEIHKFRVNKFYTFFSFHTRAHFLWFILLLKQQRYYKVSIAGRKKSKLWLNTWTFNTVKSHSNVLEVLLLCYQYSLTPPTAQRKSQKNLKVPLFSNMRIRCMPGITFENIDYIVSLFCIVDRRKNSANIWNWRSEYV